MDKKVKQFDTNVQTQQIPQISLNRITQKVMKKNIPHISMITMT